MQRRFSRQSAKCASPRKRGLAQPQDMKNRMSGRAGELTGTIPSARPDWRRPVSPGIAGPDQCEINSIKSVWPSPLTHPHRRHESARGDTRYSLTPYLGFIRHCLQCQTYTVRFRSVVKTIRLQRLAPLLGSCSPPWRRLPTTTLNRPNRHSSSTAGSACPVHDTASRWHRCAGCSLPCQL